LLNHIRSTQHPDSRVIYNLSLQPGHHKEYQPLYDGFTCCMGTGMENHVKYGEGIYFHDAEGLWVNLFMASELNWKVRGLKLRQETAWPNGETSKLIFTTVQPQELTLRLRHPWWAVNGLKVKVNGQALAVATKPSSYAEIKRQWKNGDTVEVEFPMVLRTESMPDNPNRIAIFHGPVLLAANLGPVNDAAATQPFYVPVLLTSGKPVADWVKPVSAAQHTFKTTGAGRPRDFDLVPFHSLHDRRYTVFLDVYGDADWTKREAQIRAEQQREQDLAARTIDNLRIGEMQPERDHNLQGEKTGAGDAMGRKWRHATDGGWFAFDLKVRAGKGADLMLTFWGGETGNRTFDILVEGTKVGTQKLLNNEPGKFFDVTYPIPAAVLAGKEKVTVKLQAHPGNSAGGLFGARTMESGDRNAK
jgi:hypothetical protein